MKSILTVSLSRILLTTRGLENSIVASTSTLKLPVFMKRAPRFPSTFSAETLLFSVKGQRLEVRANPILVFLGHTLSLAMSAEVLNASVDTQLIRTTLLPVLRVDVGFSVSMPMKLKVMVALSDNSRLNAIVLQIVPDGIVITQWRYYQRG